MYVYRGKFSWFNYASNEGISFIFPHGVGLNEPAFAVWEWTVDSNGVSKATSTRSGKVAAVDSSGGITVFRNPDQYYYFTGSLSSDLSSLTLTMKNPAGDTSSPFTLSVHYKDPAPLVYVGKLNWFNYAVNETITVVVPPPGNFNTGDIACVYWQWTVDSTGAQKVNQSHAVNMTVTSVGADGSRGLRIPLDYYLFNGSVTAEKNTMTLTMSNPSGETSAPITLALQFLNVSVLLMLVCNALKSSIVFCSD